MVHAAADDPQELFDLVDLSDRVIGQVRRGVAHRDPSLVHRSVQVLVFDDANRLLLQRRSAAKDLFPGYLCASASGHVLSGESYPSTAAREVEEELGVSLPLTYLGKAIVRSNYETEVTALFATRSNGPFDFNPRETDGGEFMALDALLGGNASGLRVTPALQEALDELERRRRAGALDSLLASL